MRARGGSIRFISLLSAVLAVLVVNHHVRIVMRESTEAAMPPFQHRLPIHHKLFPLRLFLLLHLNYNRLSLRYGLRKVRLS